MRRTYVKYTFLKVDPAWRRRVAEERAADKREFAAACRDFGEDHFLRAYSLVGTRGDCDLMVRAIARRSTRSTSCTCCSTRAGSCASRRSPHSYLAMTKESPYSRRARPAARAAPRRRLEVPDRLPDVEEARLVRAARRGAHARDARRTSRWRGASPASRRTPPTRSGSTTRSSWSPSTPTTRPSSSTWCRSCAPPSRAPTPSPRRRSSRASRPRWNARWTPSTASARRARALDLPASAARAGLGVSPSADPLAGGLEQLLGRGELHARAALRLPGLLLGACRSPPSPRRSRGRARARRAAPRGLSRLGSGGSFSRPASRSSSIASTVSWASRLFVPMIPVGPRLIQPDDVLAAERLASSPRMRPCSFGTVPLRSSKGTPSSGMPR